MEIPITDDYEKCDGTYEGQCDVPHCEGSFHLGGLGDCDCDPDETDTRCPHERYCEYCKEWWHLDVDVLTQYPKNNNEMCPKMERCEAEDCEEILHSDQLIGEWCEWHSETVVCLDQEVCEPGEDFVDGRKVLTHSRAEASDECLENAIPAPSIAYTEAGLMIEYASTGIASAGSKNKSHITTYKE